MAPPSNSTIDPNSRFSPQTKIFHSLRPSISFPLPPHPSLSRHILSLLRSSTASVINADTGCRIPLSGLPHLVQTLASNLRREFHIHKNDVAFILSLSLTPLLLDSSRRHSTSPLLQRRSLPCQLTQNPFPHLLFQILVKTPPGYDAATTASLTPSLLFPSEPDAAHPPPLPPLLLLLLSLPEEFSLSPSLSFKPSSTTPVATAIAITDDGAVRRRLCLFPCRRHLDFSSSRAELHHPDNRSRTTPLAPLVGACLGRGTSAARLGRRREVFHR